MLPQFVRVTIDSKKYCAQLDKLHKAVQKKQLELSNRKNMIIHHDNVRAYTSFITKKNNRALARK